MARIIRKTTVDRIFNKIYRDLGLEEISEADCIDWIGECMEHIGVVSMLEQHLAFIEVNNHKAELPASLVSIIQVARNNRFTTEKKGICHDEFVEVIEECSDCTPINTPVPLDCRGAIIGDYEVAYYRPYFDLQYEYYGWSNTRLYQDSFTPIRLSNKTLLGSVVNEEDPRIYLDSRDEYTVVGDCLRFNFKEGQIALGYYSMPLDAETGFPMIPDEVSVIQAIVSYITYKYMQRLWYLGRDGYGDKFKQAELDYQWYIEQAKTKLFGPYGLDDFQDLLEQNYSLLPNHSKYNNFFSGSNYRDMLNRSSHYGRR